MLYALFSEQRDTYARQVNKVGRIQLVVGAMDGWAIAVQDTESQVGLKCLNDKRNSTLQSGFFICREGTIFWVLSDILSSF